MSRSFFVRVCMFTVLRAILGGCLCNQEGQAAVQ